MLENDIFKIDLSIDRLNSIKENQIKPRGDWEKRMQIRKRYEEKAIDILSKPSEKLTPYDLFVSNENDIDKMGAFNFLDIDAILNNGKIIKARFGQLIPSNTKYLFNRKDTKFQFHNVNFQKFKNSFDGIMNSRNVNDFEEYYSELIAIQGIKAFLPTLILYLKDGKQYNIMTERFAKKILKNEYNFSDEFNFYIKYNTFINTFKNDHNLRPQEIDLILSAYNNPKWDQHINDIKEIDKTAHKKNQKINTVVNISEERELDEPFLNFKYLIQDILALKSDRDHKERAHESLVETFFINLGYSKHKEVQYRKGRIDISIVNNEKSMIVIEVKKEWNLKAKNKSKELQQAYNYALETGTRYIILTNGDYYLFVDRLKGLSYKDNIVGEFELTSLKKEDYEIIQKLKKEVVFIFNIEEIFKNLSLCFK